MESAAYSLFYGANEEFNSLVVPLGLLLGAILTGIFWTEKNKINRSTFVLFSGFLTFAASLSSLPIFAFWFAVENNVLWLLIFAQFLILAIVGSFYTIAAKQRSLDAFDSARYAILAFLPIINFYLMLKRSQNPNNLVTGNIVGISIAGGLFAYVAAFGTKDLIEESSVELVTPRGEQVELIQGKLREHLPPGEYLEYYIFPSFELPFKIDEYNSITKLRFDKNNIENTILHISDAPLTNSEPFVSNVKVFICDRWSWFLKDDLKSTYIFVDESNVEQLNVSVDASDCAK